MALDHEFILYYKRLKIKNYAALMVHLIISHFFKNQNKVNIKLYRNYLKT